MKHFSIALTATALLATSASVLAHPTSERSGPTGSSTQASRQEGPVVWVNTNVVTGTVTEIHRGQRMLTARTEDGRSMVLAVGPDVHNFDKLQKGDQVTIRYSEAEAIALAKHSGPKEQIGEIRTRVESFATAQAPRGASRPGLGAREHTTVVANVFDIDRERGILTLRGTSGEPVDIRANPEVLKQISKNDQLVISFTQATAVEIKPGNTRMSSTTSGGTQRGSRDASR